MLINNIMEIIMNSMHAEDNEKSFLYQLYQRFTVYMRFLCKNFHYIIYVLYIYIYIYIYIYLYIYLFIYLFIYLSIYLFIFIYYMSIKFSSPLKMQTRLDVVLQSAPP